MYLDMNGALQEIAKLRTLCRIVDPTDLDQFLEKFNHVDPTAVRGNPSHDFKIVHSNISSGKLRLLLLKCCFSHGLPRLAPVPNPILPNNRAPDLMPTVHASDIQGHINNFILNPVAPSEGGGASRPSSPLKPCLKSHARAHSAAKKKRVFIAENGNTVQDALKYNGSESAANATGGPRVITHKGLAENEWAATQAHPAVQHNDVTPTGSMFGITASNPDYEPDPSKQNHHYTPFVPPKQKLADTIKLKLDNRMLSLHQAFQHLDTTNCGYITQNELLNACWYWGIRLEPKDFSLLANEYYSVFFMPCVFKIYSLMRFVSWCIYKGGQSLTGDSRIAYNQFTDIMTKILHPTEEDKVRYVISVIFNVIFYILVCWRNKYRVCQKRSAKTVDDIMRSKLLSNGLTMRQTFSEFDKVEQILKYFCWKCV